MTHLPDLMAPAVKTSTSAPKFLVRAAIQGRLLSLPGDSVFAESVRNSAVKDFNGCLKMILSQAGDEKSRSLLTQVIGEELLNDIEAL